MITIYSVDEIDKLDKQISSVFWYIDWHKREIVEALFSDAAPDYKLEWYDREPYHFWCHLCNEYRHIVIRMALEFYNQ